MTWYQSINWAAIAHDFLLWAGAVVTALIAGKYQNPPKA